VSGEERVAGIAIWVRLITEGSEQHIFYVTHFLPQEMGTELKTPFTFHTKESEFGLVLNMNFR
jgi:hypothetical protein